MCACARKREALITGVMRPSEGQGVAVGFGVQKIERNTASDFSSGKPGRCRR